MKTSEKPERLGKKYLIEVIEDYQGWWKIMEIYWRQKKLKEQSLWTKNKLKDLNQYTFQKCKKSFP